MDWYIIEYLYPNSYKKFVDNMFPNTGVLCISTLNNYDIRKLYTFFDNQGYFLILELDINKNWTYSLNCNGWIITQYEQPKKSREQIEIDGFTYCFKQMEEHINQIQKV